MSSYPLLDVFLTMLWFFLWILWLFLIFWVLLDIFRSHNIGGWGKAGWILLVVFLPLIGVLIYVAVHGQDMADRMGGGKAEGEASYGTTTSSELSQLADLHDRGVISDEEYAAGKEKILH